MTKYATAVIESAARDPFSKNAANLDLRGNVLKINADD